MLVLAGELLKPDANDDLLEIAEGYGFIADHGADAVQACLTRAWETAQAEHWQAEENATLDETALREDDKRERADWIKQCAVDLKGRPLPNLQNAMVALRSDPALKELFKYDEMLHAAMLMLAAR